MHHDILDGNATEVFTAASKAQDAVSNLANLAVAKTTPRMSVLLPPSAPERPSRGRFVWCRAVSIDRKRASYAPFCGGEG